MAPQEVDPVLYKKVLSIAQSFEICSLSDTEARESIDKRLDFIMSQRKFDCANKALHFLAYHDRNFKNALFGLGNVKIGLSPE